MTIISNDPTWWPAINYVRSESYFAVGAFAGVMYDWVLTFGQEVELVWRQRWSLMTILYLGVRYLGILYAALSSVQTISLTDTGCLIMYIGRSWTSAVVSTMLSVIIITRLHAMYQRSRIVLIFLIVTFLASNIFVGVVVVMMTIHTSGEELILSGTYQCSIGDEEYVTHLFVIGWILSTVWEALALFLTVWIAVKHFRELRQHSVGGIFRDIFTVLIKTHMLYFTSFLAVSCFTLILELSPTLLTNISLGTQIYTGLLQIARVVQMPVLGSRLILGVREYHTKLVTDSDAAPGMTSVVFQERVHISTGSGV